MSAEVFLNDIPVAFVHPGIIPPVWTPIRHVLVEGMNAMTLVANPASNAEEITASRPRTPDTRDRPIEGQITVSILRFAEGEEPPIDEGVEVTRIVWSGEPSTSPSAETSEFSVGEELPDWAWTRARTISAVTGEVRSEVYGYLQRLHDMLARRQTDEFLSANRIRLDEADRAFDLESGSMERELRSALTAANDANLILEPLLAASIRLRRTASGRLVHCTREPRDAVLRFRHPTRPRVLSLPVSLGWVDDALAVLR